MKKRVSFLGGLLAALFLVSTASAQWIFNRGMHNNTNLVVIISSGTGEPIPEAAPGTLRDLVMAIRHFQRFPYIRYVDGPWQDTRAMSPDIVVFWGTQHNSCRIETEGRSRFIAFRAAGRTQYAIEQRVRGYLVRCVQRYARRVPY